MKIIQIAVKDYLIYALTEDGRIFKRDAGEWTEIPLPQPTVK